MAKINEHEVHDVLIHNILGDFLSANMYKDMKMMMCGRLAELVVIIVPKMYRHHLKYDKRRLILYFTLNKSLYVLLRSTFLFYEWLVAEMRGKWFELKPYDPCVENKIIGGK